MVTGRARPLVKIAAMHEAAHAVTAWALGVHVAAVEIFDNGSGMTTRKRTLPEVDAVISAAGDEWDRHLSPFPYEYSSCRDLNYQVERVGIHGVWAARREARLILTRRRPRSRDSVHGCTARVRCASSHDNADYLAVCGGCSAVGEGDIWYPSRIRK
jgi:hypothetical protein